ncbi:hypothetical protein [Mucilaginibacter rubeus]|uniref:Uncharacterized protein n=1 Tax=Mucilaginibacter rubeus TaxID=2027860 RepID=A0A5C1HXL4_9SPHI|nr:hypothetical protein [Mucilaginibacter rubeus]QEM10606.1 hypothetical protein DEO27_011440 [Mucilaginibacter rubeus]
MDLVLFFRQSFVKGILGILLIAMFAIKSCDVFVHCYTSHNKSLSADNPAENEKSAGDENHDFAEKSFEKNGKKLYSCFDNAISFKAVIWVISLSGPVHFYSFKLFTEHFREILTPPPDLFLA